MFKLFSFLVTFALVASGGLYFDYQRSAKGAGTANAGGLTFPDYLAALPDRLSNLSSGTASAAGLPTHLADMLPRAPAGWTVRPTDPKDIEGFLPKSTKKADKKGIAAVNGFAKADTGSGVESVLLTYEKGDRKLIIKAVRYPDSLFTSPDAQQERLDLQSKTAEFRGTEFASVRGLEVIEDLLPEGFRGRMFLADVGAQIQLKILAPKRTSDEDLVAFLESLHVKAMNAHVVDKVAGLGEVPVIVLVSALDEEARNAYLADVAAREAEEAAKEEADRVAAEAAQAELAPAEDNADGGGFFAGLFGSKKTVAEDTTEKPPETKIVCKTTEDGSKRCSAEIASEAAAAKAEKGVSVRLCVTCLFSRKKRW